MSAFLDENDVAARRRAERGFTMAELAFAFVIMVTAALALVGHVSSVYQRNANHFIGSRKKI